jgi:putative hydrolase of the HAD superfamily
MKAILLDALGTLVRLEPPAPSLRAELSARFGIEVTEAQAARAIAAEIAYYRAHLDEGSNPERLAALRGRCAGALRTALPPSARLDAVDPEALTEALLASLRFDAYPDVRPALERGRELGARLVVVSNWDVSLHEVLERLGLAALLDAILTSAQAGVRKPDAAIFARALALAGVSATEAVHVGDSLDEDIAGARNAGITPVLVCRDGAIAPPGIAGITALTELFETTP